MVKVNVRNYLTSNHLEEVLNVNGSTNYTHLFFGFV